MRAFYTDRGGHDAAYALLTYAYCAVYGDAMPEIKKGIHGKPYFPTKENVHFSVSHSRDFSLVVLSDSPCGCDIEQKRPVSDKLIRRACSPEELGQFEFFELWVLKESFVKAIGDFSVPMTDTHFRRSCCRIFTESPRFEGSLLSVPGAYAAAVGSDFAEIAEFISSSVLVG